MGIKRGKEVPNAHKCAFELLIFAYLGEVMGIGKRKVVKNAHKSLFSCYYLAFNEFLWAKRVKK